MKKIIVIISAVLLYSCASKIVTPPPATVPAAEKLADLETPPPVQQEQFTFGPVMPPSAEVIAQGRGLYENNCGKCHKLFATNSFTAEQWKPIVRDMQKKAQLTNEVTDMILVFLESEQQ